MKAFLAILWLLTLGCWGMMLLMTHGGPDEVRQVPSLGVNDGVDHLLGFGLLGGLLCLSIWAVFPKRPLRLWLALPALLVYAVVDEKTRSGMTPDAQMRHVLADAAGASIAVTGMYGLYGLSRLLRRSTPTDELIALIGGRPGAALGPAGGYGDLGNEIEAALASYTDGDAEVGEHFIRVEKASTASPRSNPVRAKARRVK
jgi:hypothetical protein